MCLQKIILKKEKPYFEEELAKNRKKPNKLWKALTSLGLSSEEARKSKISLKKDGKIQFKALENNSTLNQLEASKKNKFTQTNLLARQPKTTMPRIHAMYPMTLNC